MAALPGFRVPNDSSSFDDAQTELHEFDLQALAAGFNQTGVLSGCAVTAQGSPDQTVAVAAGAVSIEGLIVPVAAGNVAMAAAHATNPRYDLVTVDTSGTKGKVDGTAAANPDKPDYPDDKVVLAEVYRAANDNAIGSGEIVDKRVLSALPGIYVVKAADESVASSTVMQNDDELFFTAVSGVVYVLDIQLIYASPVGAGTPDCKFDLGEDATIRGVVGYVALSSNDSSLNAHFLCNQTATASVGTAATDRTARVFGWYVGGGGTFRVRWAQITSNANATTVRAGSYICYRRVK